MWRPGASAAPHLHPHFAPLEPHFARALSPLVRGGFVRILTGGAELGAAATLRRDGYVDTLAAHVEASLDMGRLETIIWGHAPQF